MSSELVQTGFFDNEPYEIIIDATWASLPNDAFEQAATDYHRVLDQQENVLKVMTNEVIRKKGELYIAYKAKQGHGNFINWLAKIEVSHPTAKNYMQIVRELGDTLLNGSHGSHLGFRTLRSIVHSPEKHQIAAKIEAGEIEPTPKAINAEIEAAKQREMEAKRAAVDAVKAKRQIEEEYSAASQQLSLSLENAKSNQSKLEQEIATLKLEKENMTQPQKVTVYVDTIETAAKVASLEEQIKTLEDKPVIPPSVEQEIQKIKSNLKNAQDELNFYTKQNAALAEKNKQLSEESRRSFVENIASVGHLRIQQDWNSATSELQASHRAFHLKIPSALDRESFDAEQHARTLQTIEDIEQTAALLKQTLPHNSHNMIDASSVVESPMSYISYTGDCHG